MRVVFIEPDGERHEREGKSGDSAMEIAVSSGVRGILGDCGGACACGTCHVYVGSAWLDKLPEMTDFETEMLEVVGERRSCSRLSCQIKLSDALDGLELHLPSEFL